MRDNLRSQKGRSDSRESKEPLHREMVGRVKRLRVSLPNEFRTIARNSESDFTAVLHDACSQCQQRPLYTLRRQGLRQSHATHAPYTWRPPFAAGVALRVHHSRLHQLRPPHFRTFVRHGVVLIGCQHHLCAPHDGLRLKWNTERFDFRLLAGEPPVSCSLGNNRKMGELPKKYVMPVWNRQSHRGNDSPFAVSLNPHKRQHLRLLVVVLRGFRPRVSGTRLYVGQVLLQQYRRPAYSWRNTSNHNVPSTLSMKPRQECPSCWE